MTAVVRFSRFVELCQRLRATPSRLDKLALLADYLRSLPADAIETAVAFLTARAFPASDPRALGVPPGGRRRPRPPGRRWGRRRAAPHPRGRGRGIRRRRRRRRRRLATQPRRLPAGAPGAGGARGE